MGDQVIDDAQVIFEIDQWQAGGDTGKLILDNVTLTVDRPTRGYSGIGNEAEVAVGYGTRSASLSHDAQMNREAAELLVELYENDRAPKEVSIIAGDVLDASAAKFDWNGLEADFQDDGDSTVSIDGKVRGLDMDNTP